MAQTQSKQKPPLVEVRCAGCGRFLCKTRGDVEVDCRRCFGRTFFDYDTRKTRFLPKEKKNK